jgi:hypothetical protein
MPAARTEADSLMAFRHRMGAADHHSTRSSLVTITRRSLGPRLTAAAVATLAAGAAIAATAAPASATTTVKATYKVTGSTFIKAPNFTLNLGPGRLVSRVNLKTGRLTARLSMPNATGSFEQSGIIPVTATTQFINDGPTTGRLNKNTGAVRTKSKITLRIVSLTVAGLPVPVGNSCQTKSPAAIRLTSQKGFNVLNGGNVAGSYTIPKFHHCGLATILINLTIPGGGNTITLKLGKAKLG